jgi:hypothetical protein
MPLAKPVEVAIFLHHNSAVVACCESRKRNINKERRALERVELGNAWRCEQALDALLLASQNSHFTPTLSLHRPWSELVLNSITMKTTESQC